MAGLADILLQHHRHCDQFFALALEAAAASDWEGFKRQIAALHGELDRHIDFEETDLFPAFEHASGLSAGPTQVMRAEHAEMRELLDALGAAQPRIDPEGCRAELEQLRAILQAHNVKEETVLYPACDQLLGARTDLLDGAQALIDRAPSIASH